MPTERLFLAVPLPEPIRLQLAALMTPLPDVRWTPVGQLHLTLRFLGDVDTAQIAPLQSGLATVRVQPFVLPVEGIGAFPPRSAPHVLWVGVGSGHPRLHQLRQRVDDTLLAAGLTADLRTFHPHVTLARCTDRAAGAARQWLHRHRAFAGPDFAVDRFELFASDLQPTGAIYRLLATFPLTS